MTARPKRKKIPLGVKLEACLKIMRSHLLLDEGFVEWDHHPALELRPINEAGDDYEPPQLDPRYIQPLVGADHALKTNGPRHDHSQGDKGKIAKVKRIQAKTGYPEQVKVKAKRKRKRQWPKRKFPEGQSKLRSKGKL